jgi:hypothetical protein
LNVRTCQTPTDAAEQQWWEKNARSSHNMADCTMKFHMLHEGGI